MTNFLPQLLRLSILFTPVILLTQLFSQTCSLYCCLSVIAMVSRPYAGVMYEFRTFPFSFRDMCLSPITPSTFLHALAPACTLLRISVSVSPSPQTCPPRYTKLSRWFSFFPSSLMSRSFLLFNAKHPRLL